MVHALDCRLRCDVLDMVVDAIADEDRGSGEEACGSELQECSAVRRSHQVKNELMMLKKESILIV